MHNAEAMKPLAAPLSVLKILLVLMGAFIRIPLAYARPLKDTRIHILDDVPPADDPGFWAYLGVASALVLLGGAFSGLTIALMGQDEIYLQVIATSGEGSERANAKKVLNLLKRGKHWVLVTLLLSNVITNETLPIVLDRSLGGGWAAVLGSTVLIVIFGEIAPQSICVRYGLPIGAWMAPFVLVLMWLLVPVAWPTAKLLDWLLGEDHGTMYKKAGLKTLVTLHRTLGTTPGERLNKDEVTIISAVLDLKDKTVGSIMTPMDDVFTLSVETVLDESMMNTILAEGYSRIPIHSPDNNRNFLGMLLVKMLITYDPEDCLRVCDFQLATLPETRPETSCLDIVNFFQEGKSHMVLVSDFPGEPYGALGVVTLEDVIEELIGEEIIDESDVFIDVHKAIRRMHPAPRFRVPQSEIVVQDPGDQTQDEADIFDVKPKHRLTEPLLDDKEAPVAEYKPSMTELGRSSTTASTTIVTRRRSSGQSEPAAIRSSAPDIRQHLRHLGPSNRAAQPKQTRISTVKIKPGVDQMASVPETRQLQVDSKKPLSRPQSAREPAEATNDESAALLSAGHGASDAVHAVQYGTLSTSPTAKNKDVQLNMNGVRPIFDRGRAQTSPSPLRQHMQSPDNNESLSPANQPSSPPATAATQSTSFTTEEHQDRSQGELQTPAKMVVDLERQPSHVSQSADAADAADVVSDVGELPAITDGDEDDSEDEFGRRRRRGLGRTTLARSGSITEQIIDAPGGLRKLVLETTSSSEDAEHEAMEADAAYTEAAPPASAAAVTAADGPKGGGAGRKKKRRHKKHGKKHGGSGGT